MSAERLVPGATYRVQLSPAFGFDELRGLIPYLANLGVTHVYCSPYLQAAPGSTHGYDVVDHHQVNEELGGGLAHARFCAALQEHGLGQVIDIVPNHMSVTTDRNRWWWDVLERGVASRYARYFDVDWKFPDPTRQNKLLLPILGAPLDEVLDEGRVRVVRDADKLCLRVYQRKLPLAPASLRALSEAFPGLEDPANEALDRLNQDKGALRSLLAEQPYRPIYWKAARGELNYRRFFHLNELAALRMEDPQVFADTHALVLHWVRKGWVDGLRVDHPDGLRDPGGYLETLRAAAPDVWIVVEKILERGESLPTSWPVDGTTGYDFLAVVGGLFVDSEGEGELTRCYREFTGLAHDFDALVREKKRLVTRELLPSDVRRLARRFNAVCRARRGDSIVAPEETRAVIEETLAWFPIYRTYCRPGERASGRDAAVIKEAVTNAAKARPELAADLFALLGDVLCGIVDGDVEREVMARFQQLSGPVMAKGVEDTAFFCDHRLISLNEVGADPSCFGPGVEAFHAHCSRVQSDWPTTMTATSTHDTKRGEDVRIRISLLSEIPDRWREAVQRWAAMNEPFRVGDIPDRNTEYLLYQTLVGTWPIEEERVIGFICKAAREAKTHTSWRDPNEGYERGLERFVASVARHKAFIHDLQSFLEPLRDPARTHALSQVLLKLCAPGVPDIYQGEELWDNSLTDPDNRRPVDFTLREHLLEELRHLPLQEIVSRANEGLPKLWVIQRALQLRRQRADAFGPQATYQPVFAEGPHAHRVVCFTRDDDIAVIAPRMTLGLDAWGGTSISLAPGHWHNVLDGRALSGGRVEIEALVAHFPVALLARRRQK